MTRSYARIASWRELTLALTVPLMLAGCSGDDDSRQGDRKRDPADRPPVFSLAQDDEEVCGELLEFGAGTPGSAEITVGRLDATPPVEFTFTGPKGSPRPSSDAQISTECVRDAVGEPRVLIKREDQVKGVDRVWFGVLENDLSLAWQRYAEGELLESEPDLRLVRPDGKSVSFQIGNGKPGEAPAPVQNPDQQLSMDFGAALEAAGGKWRAILTDGSSIPLPDVTGKLSDGVTGSYLPDGVLLATGGGHLTRLDLLEGSVVWSREFTPIQSNLDNVIAADEGTVTVDDETAILQGKDVEVTALDLDSGKTLWELDPAKLSGLPAANREAIDVDQVSGGRVLISVEHKSADVKYALLLDARTGDQLPTYGAPITGLTPDGYVVAAKTGEGREVVAEAELAGLGSEWARAFEAMKKQNDL